MSWIAILIHKLLSFCPNSKPSSNSFQRNVNAARFRATAAESDGKLWLVGGYDWTNRQVKTIDYYIPQSAPLYIHTRKLKWQYILWRVDEEGEGEGDKGKDSLCLYTHVKNTFNCVKDTAT